MLVGIYTAFSRCWSSCLISVWHLAGDNVEDLSSRCELFKLTLKDSKYPCFCMADIIRGKDSSFSGNGCLGSRHESQRIVKLRVYSTCRDPQTLCCCARKQSTTTSAWPTTRRRLTWHSIHGHFPPASCFCCFWDQVRPSSDSAPDYSVRIDPLSAGFHVHAAQHVRKLPAQWRVYECQIVYASFAVAVCGRASCIYCLTQRFVNMHLTGHVRRTWDANTLTQSPASFMTLLVPIGSGRSKKKKKEKRKLYSICFWTSNSDDSLQRTSSFVSNFVFNHDFVFCLLQMMLEWTAVVETQDGDNHSVNRQHRHRASLWRGLAQASGEKCTLIQ